MTPTWYDILGVEPDATPEQIKAAWRDSTDKFEPGTGGSRFRMFNEAADVLLDPEKRRAYDAELAGAAVPSPEPVVEPAAEVPTATAVEPLTDLPSEPATDEPATDEPAPAATVATAPAASLPRRVVTWFTTTLGLAILAVLATASVVLAVVLGLDLDNRVDDAASSPGSFDLADGTAASSVAERAVAAVLAYDYRNMDAGRDRAVAFLTPAYQKTYEKIFDGLIAGTPQAPGGAIETKAVVKSEVLGTSVVDADEDQVRVLVFVNQQPTRDGKQQPLLANRVIASMVLRDGTWLLDGLDPLSAGF